MGVTAGIFLASILLFPPARNVPRVTKLLSGIMFQGKIQNFGGNSGGIFKITFCINFPMEIFQETSEFSNVSPLVYPEL
jgi:hypothetical protein